MPRGTLAVANVVAALPIENAARSLEPDAEPASRTYAVARQLPLSACQLNVTAPPLTDETSPLGGAGAPVQVPPAPTVRTISFDGALVPAAVRARTRMK